ncbi:hypothetical protein [Anaerofustis butyriciformans]
MKGLRELNSFKFYNYFSFANFYFYAGSFSRTDKPFSEYNL